MPGKLNNAGLVLGLMSGTSLDGLDLALCRFERDKSAIRYELIDATTVAYGAEWKQLLTEVQSSGAEQYLEADVRYGRFIAEQVNHFLKGRAQQPALIASHGHTVFHQPGRGFSAQLGSGAVIAALTGITTVCDFRSVDVALGGQGAPLVPIGDGLLFPNFEACLNIGGIANISLSRGGQRYAYDICEANMLLNLLAAKAGQAYDEGGRLAAAGVVNDPLLQRLNALPYYTQTGARSLGREWFETNIQPHFATSTLSVADQLATATAHIADVITADVGKHGLEQVLVTGGGAFNTHLMDTIRQRSTATWIVPDDLTVQFKEALIFGLLGYLRVQDQVNALASVTGARRDSIGGAIYAGAH